MSELPSHDQTIDHELLAELADDFAARYRRGEHPTIEEYARKHPALAAEIHDAFPALMAMEQPGLDPTADIAPTTERVGAVIGRYKLLEWIGEGGFGVVFMAEQQFPVRRKVALKLIKPGVDTRQVIARFEAERQALALMEHENIAKVLDAGATESGRPYFVMELVRGVPITEYCDKNLLTPQTRLELFVKVCRAVQHAHTKGVIHRDIKPTNVLVTLHDGVPVPKVIDFGVAKATGQQLTEKTLFTHFAQMVGTPLYMSPEQAEMSGLDVDTRSDVYSLGVLLYELLTGSTPFDSQRFGKAALDEVRRIIREEEPPKPSTRLSTSATLPVIAACRGLEPKKLSGLVKGELDWIVMKALEKDRTRRYETANGMATDVQRYLDDEAVQACPPSARYRFRKFARRNKQILAVVALLAAGLLVVVSAIAASIGWATRDRAARQALLEQRIANALQESEQHYAHYDLPEATLAVRRAEDLLAGAAATPALQQRVRRWRADVEMVKRLDDIRMDKIRSTSSFDWREADAAYAEAFSTYAIDIGHLSPQEAGKRISASSIAQRLIWALDDWRLAKIPAGNLAGGAALLEVADLADTDAVRKRVRRATARSDPEELRKLAEDNELFDQQPPETACLLVLPLRRTGQSPRALEVLRRAERQHPDDFWLNYDIGWMLMPGKPGEAAQFLRAAMTVSPRHPSVHFMLGLALVARGDAKEGEAEYREALRLDPNHARAHESLYKLLRSQKRLDETQEAYAQLLRLDPNNHAMCSDLARFLLTDTGAQHDPSFPLRLSRKAVQLAPDYQQNWDVLGLAEYRAGNLRQAAAALGEAAKRAQSELSSWYRWGTVCLYSNDLQDYRRACSEMLDHFGHTDDSHYADCTAKMCALAPGFGGDPQRVMQLAELAMAGSQEHPDRKWYETMKGLVDYRAGRFGPAADIVKHSAPSADGFCRDAMAFSVLAMAQHRLGQSDEAHTALSNAKGIIATKMPMVEKGESVSGDWLDWLHAKILCREAEQVLKGSPASTQKSQ